MLADCKEIQQINRQIRDALQRILNHVITTVHDMLAELIKHRYQPSTKARYHNQIPETQGVHQESRHREGAPSLGNHIRGGKEAQLARSKGGTIPI